MATTVEAEQALPACDARGVALMPYRARRPFAADGCAGLPVVTANVGAGDPPRELQAIVPDWVMVRHRLRRRPRPRS